MKVLIGCEESQAVCIAFREKGHEAYSCDILPCSGGHPEWHLQMDVLEAIKLKEWDMGVFFPPCTRLCNSGVRWLDERNLWDEMRQAAAFFNRFVLMGKSGMKVAIENPIQHKYARNLIEKYHQII